jgi:N-acetylmuramic acid 6-phosphate etherase
LSVVSVLAVDLGKTSSRVALVVDGQVLRHVRAAGTPGLAHPGGLAAALAVTVRLARELTSSTEAGAAESGAFGAAGVLEAVGIGSAGTRVGAAAAAQLAVGVRDTLGVRRVAVTNDAVAAHVGALGGAPGVVLIAGTGAVALAVGPSGSCSIVDGAGWWLGDEGSGAWVGAGGLRAVLRAADGRGPATVLSDAAVRRFGSLDAVRALVRELNPAAIAASFGPDVAAAARAGDPVAMDILARASAALAATTLAAVDAVSYGDDVTLSPSKSPSKRGNSTSSPAVNNTSTVTETETQPETQPEARPVPVALVGGLAEWGEVLLGPWRAALSSGVRVVDAPPHAALLGAAKLVTRTDLPHERLVHRVSGAPRATDPLAVDELPTEQVRPGLDDLDTRRAADIVEVMLAAEAAVPVALAAAAPQLAAAVDLAVDRMADGGRLIYVGAGTPGRLAALDAAECGPTFGVPPDRVLAVLAGGQGAATTSVAGAEDDSAAGGADLAAQRITPDDVVVGISASGRTPYVLGALAEAGRANAATVAIVNNAGSPLAAAADIAIEVLTGAEVIAGSTRLTAGTAQKIALNVLSTATMVRLGKTFGGWMVDISPGNVKLRRRALRIIREAAGVDADTARRALDDAAGETPTALVALLLGVDTATARTRLAAAGGRVRAAIGS